MKAYLKARRLDRGRGGSEAYPEAKETYPGTVKARISALKAHPELMETHPGAMNV